MDVGLLDWNEGTEKDVGQLLFGIWGLRKPNESEKRSAVLFDIVKGPYP